MAIQLPFGFVRTRFLLYPLLGFGILHFFNTGHVFGSRQYFINGLISTLYTAILWEGNQQIVGRMKQHFPHHSQTSRRILTQAAVSLLFIFIALIIIQILLNLIFSQPLLDFADMEFSVKPSILATLLITTIVEAIYFFERWKSSLLEAEQLKRAHIQSQYETLKNQVNPHFLFNSLNTLITIIPEDPQTAVAFVQKLADVYRYVLQSKDKELVTLAEEMQIVKAYVFLLKTRFGDNLQVKISISDQAMQLYVAPLTVQMLLENAIKHNIVSSEKPLLVEVYTDDPEKLVVRNVLQRKNMPAPAESTHTGLANITQRYKLLSDIHIEILASDTTFAVTLPLLTVSKNHLVKGQKINTVSAAY
jgi:sensor histidine kinase YesM